MDKNTAKTNDKDEELSDKADALNTKNTRSGIEEWLDEHGHPDFDSVKSLAVSGDPEALETLKSVAEDLDVEYDPNASPEELAERISEAAIEGDGPEFTV